MNNQKLNAEILGVLMALGYNYINKIPKNVMKHLTENCDVYKIPSIDKNKRIEEQNISDEARAFITMLKLKYWCKTEKEKKDIIKKLSENEKKYQEELQQKYNVNNIFDNKKSKEKTEKQNTNIAIIESKKINFIIQLLNKIKNLFYKNNN